MSYISVNFNNAKVKMPSIVVPTIKYAYILRRYISDSEYTNYLVLKIDDNLHLENFYKEYTLEIYINDRLFTYLRHTNNVELEIADSENMLSNSVNYCKIMGVYKRGYEYESDFGSILFEIKRLNICSERLTCNTKAPCNDSKEGFLVDNVFYKTRTLNAETEEFEYSEAIPPEANMFYEDKLTGKVYVYNDSVYNLL